MIIIDCIQGSEEWKQARLGKITASNFDRIITPKTMKPSSSMAGYAYELLAEEILGRPLDDASSSFMERGHDLEVEARDWYGWDQDVNVERVGFVMRDDAIVGCSPDGLVGTDGGIEIKCPSAAVHMSYLLGEAEVKYFCQIQGTLWVMGRQWWDFVSYCPGFPEVRKRFVRDEEFIGKLSACVEDMKSLLSTHRATLREMGALPDVSLMLDEAA